MPTTETGPKQVAHQGHNHGAKTGSNVTIRLCRPGSNACQRLKPERISDMLPEEGSLIWVDIQDPTAENLKMLREEFGFHRLALQDAAQQQLRPKVDEYPDYYFVVMYAPLPAEPGKQLCTVEVDLFVGRNYVVSLHQGEIPALEDAEHRFDKTDPELRHDVGFLLHTLVDALIDAYFPVVDTLEDNLDDLELRMLRGAVDMSPEDLIGVKRSLLTLRKAVYPMREVFNTFLRRDNALFSHETLPYFQDVYDHVLRLLDIIDIQRDMATGVMDAHLAVVSNRLNETMKTLTVAAVCVAILGAVFGAWGMNFSTVPLADMGLLGFTIVTGGTLLFLVLFVYWGKRKKIF